jgi:hypothetical protein
MLFGLDGGAVRFPAVTLEASSHEVLFVAGPASAYGDAMIDLKLDSLRRLSAIKTTESAFSKDAESYSNTDSLTTGYDG